MSVLSVCLSVCNVGVLWPNGWMDKYETWHEGSKMELHTEVDLVPGHIVLDGNPAAVPKIGGRAPNFRPISIVAKRLDGSRCH